MDIIGVGYIGIESPNIDAWRDYGPNVLGMGVGVAPEGDEQSLYLRMDDRRHRIAIHPGPIDRVSYIGWEAVGRVAFNAAVEKFRAAGVEITVGDEALRKLRGVRELIRFKDPVGFQHELFYGQKWDPHSFVSGLPNRRFVADERGLGHIVVITPEYTPALESFLIDVMGFHWYGAGAGKGKTGFFRSKLNNKTSHDIAYGLRPGSMGLQHIGIFFATLRDLGETYDIVQKRGIQMQMTLGQHTQDPHLSFYHFTPSGFVVEAIHEFEPWPGDPFELNPERLSLWGHEVTGPILGPSVRPLEDFQ
ncbi:2,3-dihydroxybiphenyl 1,2-dioxygenase [Azospirillum oryzae]|uniref:2,3-dihydroxybiphenyl 1,2-dioxygenase n=1 Tax=Azospirillum oryzae TaxID=286727 RepID=A0A1X7ELB9_9PROT|nr:MULTISPECIES: VOC family protein [Azospirillum]QCG95809.1 2,3-dihydroxybiphenyl 1,2-dioxygenase [Azospirillum sp. TSA2s]SMF35486.1 2,3-dihydroxybiphenyl 1,2-dioxygenase [Azospirillum oryzae]